MRVPTAVITSAGLIGGYAVAAGSGSRPAGGVVLALAGAWATWQCRQQSDGKRAAALLGVYLVSFAGSHGLALVMGAWPSVLVVTAVTAAAAVALGDRAATTRPA